MTVENVETPLSAAEVGRFFSGSCRPSAFLLGRWHSAACKGSIPSDLDFSPLTDDKFSPQSQMQDGNTLQDFPDAWRAHAFRADILPREKRLQLRETGQKLRSFTEIRKNNSDDLFSNSTLYLSPVLLWHRLSELAYAALYAGQPLGRSGRMQAGLHVIGYRAVIAPLRDQAGRHGVIGTLEHVFLDSEDAEASDPDPFK